MGASIIWCCGIVVDLLWIYSLKCQGGIRVVTHQSEHSATWLAEVVSEMSTKDVSEMEK
ncbi:unnamed protein product [Prunus armeniaca]|uniref:Uncharacterized protein n=1 Tax=Prunus armeniaca TaxID=36596 RepID=A0A6J5XZ39_PRUAR|nr:unnamed protein product [Prunus armeniaca]CAB4303899.1 unnamed protein product [Prunus armeniaca]CAB4317523.1 unnamed protein product [Prunus armeniaca]